MTALHNMLRDPENIAVGRAVRPKPVHRATMLDNRGNASAACFARPRPIDLRRASWTICDDAVTCPKCIAAGPVKP